MIKIIFKLDQDEKVDPNDPVGDITIISDDNYLLIKSTYLDSWFDVLIEGYQNLQHHNSITLDIIEEPESITFEPVLNGFKLSYAKQDVFFTNLNEFYLSLLVSAKEFLQQLDQDQDSGVTSSLLAKIRHFTQQLPPQNIIQKAIAV